MLGKQLVLSVLVAASLSYVLADEELSREKRAPLGVFSIIKFPNDACEGSGNSKNGTCYTQEECESKGGTNSGSCASGYGVCCIFSGGCGQTFSENCTYFESSNVNDGECRFKVCKCNDNICQLRLDFDQFTITGPSTSTTTGVTKIVGGNVASGGASVTSASQCLTDTFSVTNPNGLTPSAICGTNSGEHMYVDASECCNDLTFQFGQDAIGTGGTATRQWSIKVTQYSCDYSNLAPEGCTQYYFGSNTDTVRTYNFNGDIHIADQDQNICVRRERGMCRICWVATDPLDFGISGATSGTSQDASSSVCGRYGTAGTLVSTYDLAIIPGASKKTAVAPTTGRIQDHFCGQKSGLVVGTSATTTDATVCSTRQPFSVRFLSDHYEGATEATTVNQGFQLSYTMYSSNC